MTRDVLFLAREGMTFDTLKYVVELKLQRKNIPTSIAIKYYAT